MEVIICDWKAALKENRAVVQIKRLALHPYYVSYSFTDSNDWILNLPVDLILSRRLSLQVVSIGDIGSEQTLAAVVSEPEKFPQGGFG